MTNILQQLTWSWCQSFQTHQKSLLSEPKSKQMLIWFTPHNPLILDWNLMTFYCNFLIFIIRHSTFWFFNINAVQGSRILLVYNFVFWISMKFHLQPKLLWFSSTFASATPVRLAYYFCSWLVFVPRNPNLLIPISVSRDNKIPLHFLDYPLL